MCTFNRDAASKSSNYIHNYMVRLFIKLGKDINDKNNYKNIICTKIIDLVFLIIYLAENCIKLIGFLFNNLTNNNNSWILIQKFKRWEIHFSVVK